jgi:uncharacterized membrane protein YdcZ (DUF606 family)
MVKENGQRVAFRKIPLAVAVAAFGGAIGNVALWVTGNAVSRLTIGVFEVILFSVMGVLVGAVLFALLGWLTRRPMTYFTILSVVFLILYGSFPILAAKTPYYEGGEMFNTATVIVTELMHLVSGGFAIFSFTRLARAED